MLVPLTAGCIAGAALTYQLAVPVLDTILKVEGGRIGVCTVNVNGTHDCGPAQINAETWVPRFAMQLRRSTSDVFDALRDNGCFNIYAAAYIVRVKVIEAKGNVWDGLGRYNSATPALKHAYQQKLIEAYRELFPPAR